MFSNENTRQQCLVGLRRSEQNVGNIKDKDKDGKDMKKLH